jgi:hypothetical protein
MKLNFEPHLQLRVIYAVFFVVIEGFSVFCEVQYCSFSMLCRHSSISVACFSLKKFSYGGTYLFGSNFKLTFVLKCKCKSTAQFHKIDCMHIYYDSDVLLCSPCNNSNYN